MRSAPYFHNGKARTLRERLANNPGDAHGKTSNLSSAQLDDLVAYLKTLRERAGQIAPAPRARLSSAAAPATDPSRSVAPSR